MQRPTKLLLVGVLLAALIGVAGWLNLLRLEGNLRTAQEKCERDAATNPAGLGFRLACEPRMLTKDLYTVDYVKPPGVQGEVVDAQRALWGHSPDAFAISAIAVFVFFAIPWCWYFLLRRLREMSDAIRGR